jgi:ABC-type enterobactin transport system permease subunit
LNKNWKKLANAVKGSNFITMMKNANQLVRTFKEMEEGKEKATLIGIMSNAARAKQVLTSPLEKQMKFVEKIKSVWI